MLPPNLSQSIKNDNLSRGAIKARIRFLQATFGSVLNTWPPYAQEEYRQLSRQLRRLEGGVE